MTSKHPVVGSNIRSSVATSRRSERSEESQPQRSQVEILRFTQDDGVARVSGAPKQ